MPRRKQKTGRISVFKGREAKLNCAIFQILAVESPLTIYDVCKKIKTKKDLRHTKYTNVNRRIKELKKSGYLQTNGIRKTKAGFQTILYQMTTRAYLAVALNVLDLDNFIQTVNEENATVMIAVLA